MGTVAGRRRRSYSRGIRFAVLSCLLVLAAAGCGGEGTTTTTSTVVIRTTTPQAAAECLNTVAFVVDWRGRKIRGSSPGGVNFTVTFYESAAAADEALARLDPQFAATIAATVVDFSGNPPRGPDAGPTILLYPDLASLRNCIEIRRLAPAAR